MTFPSDPFSQDALRVSSDDRPVLSSGAKDQLRPVPPQKEKPKEPQRRAPRSKAKPRSFFGKLLTGVLSLAILGIMVLLVVIGYYARGMPDVSELGKSTRKPTVTLVDAEGNVFATYGDIYAEPLRLEDLPPYLPAAVLATEDRRFYTHFGIDPLGMARAVLTNARAGGVVQGGSTITQQVAKIVFLKPERTLRRKVQEALLAFWLESTFSKRDILTIYLNRAYMGAGTFGVDAAARRYFGKSARDVSLYEAALLAGLLKAPSRYNPATDPEAARARTNQVLANMVDAEVLTTEEAGVARNEGGKVVAQAKPTVARYFLDWILEQVYADSELRWRDVTVTTTIDPKLQKIAEQRLKEMLNTQGAPVNATQGAVVVLAPDGAVKALVGGRDYDDSQFNRATEALRQPGSSFKTFVYLAAVESGRGPDDMVLDAPIRMGDWSPDNYTGKYLGEISLRRALAESINTSAVRLAEDVGLRKVISTAQRLGIASPLRYDATLALGSSEVTPLEMTAAFAPFANGGFKAAPYGILEISENNGPVLRRHAVEEPARVIDPLPLAKMQDMLQAVVDSGTGRAAHLDRPAAGKTGTSQNYRDAWFVGFTADYVAGVWIGNDDSKPMKKVVGGNLPARLWKYIMTAAHTDLPARPLSTPVHETQPANNTPWWGGAAPAPSTPGQPAPAPSAPPAESEEDLWQSILRRFSVGPPGATKSGP